jgi:hypothetical protein
VGLLDKTSLIVPGDVVRVKDDVERAQGAR